MAVTLNFGYDPSTGTIVPPDAGAGAEETFFTAGNLTAPPLSAFTPFTPTTDTSSPTACTLCALLQKVALQFGVPPWVIVAAAAIIGFAVLDHFGGP